MKYPVSVFLSIGVLAIRLDNRVGLSLVRSFLIHICDPFDLLPTEIVRHTGVLHITRTWHLDKNTRLITR